MIKINFAWYCNSIYSPKNFSSKRRILLTKRKEFSSNSVSSSLNVTKNSNQNTQDQLSHENEGFMNKGIRKVEAVSRISTVSTSNNSSKSNLHVDVNKNSSCLYSKRRWDEMYQALDSIRCNLFGSDILPLVSPSKIRFFSPDERHIKDHKRSQFVPPSNKIVKISKAVIFPSKIKSSNINRNFSPRIDFGKTANRTDIRVMKLL